MESPLVQGNKTRSPRYAVYVMNARIYKEEVKEEGKGRPFDSLYMYDLVKSKAKKNQTLPQDSPLHCICCVALRNNTLKLRAL